MCKLSSYYGNNQLICIKIHANSEKRTLLIRFLPKSKRAEFEAPTGPISQVDSETEQGSETEGATDAQTDSAKDHKHEICTRLDEISDKAWLILTHLTNNSSANEKEVAWTKAFTYATVPLYVEICNYLGIHMKSRCTKQQLHDLIVKTVSFLLKYFIINGLFRS